MNLAFLDKKFDEKSFLGFLTEVFDNFKIKKTAYNDEALKDKEQISAYKYLGEAFLDDKSEIEVLLLKSPLEDIATKKIDLSTVIKKLMETQVKETALVVVFNAKSLDWKLTLVSYNLSDRTDKGKRYSYTLGENIPTKTAKIQLKGLIETKERSQKNLEEAFSVEGLNDKFFADYKKLFEKLNSYLEQNNFSNFQRDASHIRAFSKKLLGRITFLYFLQKKGWLGVAKNWGDGDKAFLKNLLTNSIKEEKNFYEEYLKAVFFEALNRKREKDYFKLLECKMPFLNGGLFERKADDNIFLMIDNALFKEIFETLSHYNFTIIEDSPHESEVAIDPEMLGKVFENLLEENYKSGKGAFYTPREIVHYMCKESIYEYLITDNSQDKEGIKKLIFEGELDPSLDPKKIKSKIESIKILDPAIGSGAFPMGLLSELIHILKLLDSKLDVVKSKIDIIQNAIYGIDIDASAVEIAQLRFWLSIVVDEVEPRPLPNLDFKIMIGNSLLETIYGEDPLKGKRGLNEKIDSLSTLFSEFYDPYKHPNKNQIIEQISKNLTAIFKPLSERYSKQRTLDTDEKNLKKDLDNAFKAKDIEDILKSLSNKGFSNKLFLYKLFFKDILKEGGFDIVIGNPPYLRVQGINKEVSAQYKKTFKSATGSYDLYVLFTEKALELLSPNGIANFIMPHKWINSSFGKGLRGLSHSNISKFISFGAYQVFNASTYTSLVWFKKSKNKILDYVEVDRDLSTNKELEKYLFGLKDDDYTKIKNSDLGADSWVFTDKQTYEILEKLKKQPLRVSDVFEYTSQGIVTTGNDIFYLKGRFENDKFIGFSKALDKEIILEKNIVKPILLGKDVKRYAKIENKYFVIYPHLFDKNKTKPFTEKYLKDNYPLTYEYLLNFKDELIAKKIKYKNNSSDWFSLTRPREINIYEQNKLITPQLSLGGYFTYDVNNYYIDAGCYSFIKHNEVKESYKFYMAILNSKVCWFFMKNTSSVFSGGYFYYKPIYINPFPLPKIENIEDTKPFEILVDYVMFAKEQSMTLESSYFESIINGMVYDLYFEDEMKKADCYISDEVKDIVLTWSENSSIEIKKQFIILTYQAFKASNIIERGLIYSRTIDEIKVINGDIND